VKQYHLVTSQSSQSLGKKDITYLPSSVCKVNVSVKLRLLLDRIEWDSGQRIGFDDDLAMSCFMTVLPLIIFE